MVGVNGVEIKVGQVWRTRGGKLATVTGADNDPEYPINLTIGGEEGFCCGRNGRCWGDSSAEDTSDLIELVGDENVNTHADSATLAEETLSALGWTFDGQTWVENGVVTMEPNALDVQVGGSHYKDCAIQPIEYIYANQLGFAEGNVVKYITRWKAKNGLKDLEKARHYIDLLIELEIKQDATQETNRG